MKKMLNHWNSRSLLRRTAATLAACCLFAGCHVFDVEEINAPQKKEAVKALPAQSDSMQEEESENSLLTIAKFGSYLITQNQMEESLKGFIRSLESDKEDGTQKAGGRSAACDNISLEVVRTDKIGGADCTGERAATETIDSVDFYLYKASVGDETKYAITTNDLRIGTIIAVVDDMNESEENPFKQIFNDCLKGYVDTRLSEWNAINGARSTSYDILASGEYTIDNTSWHYNDGMNEKWLLKTKWEQGSPYNAVTLEQIANGKGEYTGCGVVSMAQICAYYRWPKVCTSAPYNGIRYNWGDMLTKPEGKDLSNTGKNDVAILMYELGQKLGAKYGTTWTNKKGVLRHGTGTPIGNTSKYLKDNGWSFNDWSNYDYNKIKKSLKQKKPVICVGGDDCITHEWVIDGWSNCTCTVENKKTKEKTEITDNFVHCNLGWGGSSNGYYLSGLFDTNNVPYSGTSRSLDDGNYSKDIIIIYNVYHTTSTIASEVSSLTEDSTIYIPQDFMQSDLPGLVQAVKNSSYKVILDFHDALEINNLPMNCFTSCTNLKGIILPESLVSIENYAFKNCAALESVTIPGSVTSIGANAFAGCTAVTTIELPASIIETVIPVLPKDATLVIYGTNSDFSNIKNAVKKSPYKLNLDLSNTTELTLLPSKGFEECPMLKGISLPDSLATIGYRGFADCDSLESVKFGNRLTQISSNAFESCSLLKEVIIPESEEETSIDSNAFYGCTSLKEIVIPSSVKKINRCAFKECSLLKRIIFNDSYSWYRTDDSSNCYNKTGGTFTDTTNPALNAEYFKETYANSYWYSLNETKSKYATIDDIADVILNLTQDTKIILTGTITSIGSIRYIIRESPYNISLDLSRVTGLTFIKEDGFAECKNLIEVILPNTIETIQNSAFDDCTALTNIIIPASVTYIESGAFPGCSSLRNITFENPLCWFRTTNYNDCNDKSGGYSADLSNSKTNAEYFTKTYNSFYWYKTETIYTTVSDIANAVSSLKKDSTIVVTGDVEGHELKEIHSATLNSKYKINLDLSRITGYGASAIPSFQYDSNIKCVTLPEHLTTINSYVFYGCESLKKITLPDSLENIGYCAFSECSSLNAVTIPKSVTKINSGAFSFCYSLTSINVQYGNQNYSSNSGVLFNKDKTTLICCPGGKTGSYAVPKKVAKIDDSAFAGCISLKKVTIPESVTCIGSQAFSCCQSLETITFNNASSWFRTTNASNWNKKTGGTATNVSNATTNAKYFTNTYEDYYWYKK